MNCSHCNVETTNLKFCSRSCASSSNNRIPKRKKIVQRCVSCDVVVARRRYCKNCFDSHRKTNIIQMGNQTLKEIKDEVRKVNVPPSYSHARVRYHCSLLWKSLAKACQVCGYSTHVELCHVKAIKDHNDSDTLSIINKRDNIVFLCPNHHWELDNGKMSL